MQNLGAIMGTTDTIARIVAALLARVRSGTLSQRELSAVFNNVTKYEAITDEQREQIVEAVESEIRTRFPTRATKLFGKKDHDARELIQRVLNNLGAQQIVGNQLRPGVKTGGSQLNGTRYINVYASYRNDRGNGASIDVNQDTVESEPYCSVGKYQVGGPDGSSRDTTSWPLSNFDAAEMAYIARVKDITTIG
jgi:hypothetical protein